MNDQTNSQIPKVDPPLEAVAELDLNLDRGELSETTAEPKTEPELRVESQNKIEANFQIAVDIRNKAIEQGAVSREDADNFIIIEGTPKARDIYTQFTKTTKELKDRHDSQGETDTLRKSQAELMLAFAYNTVALLDKYYKKKMHDDVLAISDAINRPGKRSKEQVRQVFEEKISGMSKIATDLETFHTSVDHLVPELVRQFPELQVSCDEKNAQLMTYLGRKNNLRSKSDQSSQELERFVDDLQGTISLSRIHNITVVFEALFNRQYPADAGRPEETTVDDAIGQGVEEVKEILEETEPQEDKTAD